MRSPFLSYIEIHFMKWTINVLHKQWLCCCHCNSWNFSGVIMLEAKKSFQCICFYNSRWIKHIRYSIKNLEMFSFLKISFIHKSVKWRPVLFRIQCYDMKVSNHKLENRLDLLNFCTTAVESNETFSLLKWYTFGQQNCAKGTNEKSAMWCTVIIHTLFITLW